MITLQVADKVKLQLLQRATPDSVIRLRYSNLSEEAPLLIDQYFEHRHESLASYLQGQLKRRNSDSSTTGDIFTQVHEHLLQHNYSQA